CARDRFMGIGALGYW
nr:immunoglobulin heavy chain junction region [Macaca mulatta]MOX63776.1 immunoglobulin heavy chain junction region [Macaca mulatta]MOX64407.1 immunoglobulin heavy chain junction region [Macaca mulatta]MOX65584.1 immunoglobulin heavy chain junction region [Macaca mulatta]MOX66960.1 immunoglobulin heavy chain junction region [Macaca mulatta]